MDVNPDYIIKELQRINQSVRDKLHELNQTSNSDEVMRLQTFLRQIEFSLNGFIIFFGNTIKDLNNQSVQFGDYIAKAERNKVVKTILTVYAVDNKFVHFRMAGYCCALPIDEFINGVEPYSC